MPTVALRTLQRLFHIDPPNPPLVAERLRLPVGILGMEDIVPYVFLDPGRPFSVVSHSIAARLTTTPVPVRTDPVRVEAESLLTGGLRPTRPVAAGSLTAWEGHPCDFIRTSIQFRDRVSGALTTPLDPFAHRPLVVVPNFADRFVILGYSFLRDNSADVTIAPVGSAVGRLTVR
jgi:hypothetical protein